MNILFIGAILLFGIGFGYVIAAIFASGKIEDLERTIRYQRGLLSKK